MSYNLSTFKNCKIRPESKVFNIPPEDRNPYGKYGFNKQGFLTTSEIYDKGQLTNFGFYTKNEKLIEYVEFSVERGVPSSIQRVFVENGKKTIFQSVFANGRNGFHLNNGTSLKEKLILAFNDGYSAVCNIEEFKYENDNIARAYGLHILPGIGEHLYENIYSYANDRLLEIKTYNENGNTAIAYVSPSGKSLTSIANQLSILFCDYLIDVLKKQHFDGPLFCVELNYRLCDNYFPYLVVLNERQKDKAVANKSDDLFNQGVYLATSTNIPIKLEELYSEFYQLLEKKDAWETGRKMLIQTAKLMTKYKLNNEVAVTEDFITFPIEWEFEGGELGKILFQCGASRYSIKEWKRLGWIYS